MRASSILPGAHVLLKILLTPHWVALIKAWLIFDVRLGRWGFTVFFRDDGIPFRFSAYGLSPFF